MLTFRYWPKFQRQLKKLPVHIKEQAEQKLQVFRNNPFDPSLRTHKLHGLLEGCWAFSINYSYRVIFGFFDEHTVEFYSIGNHDIYE